MSLPIPEKLRPIAKAVIAFLVTLVGTLVVFGIIDVPTGEKITGELAVWAIVLGLGAGAAVERTTNRPSAKNQ